MPYTVEAGQGNGNGSTPKGQPFVYIQSQIEDISNDISRLEAYIDSVVERVNTIHIVI